MVQAIRMPMMGNTMESGLVAEWRAEEGDDIEEEDIVAIVESEKATAEIVANQKGTLARVDVAEGEEVPPGTLLGVIVSEDESLDEAPPPRSRIKPSEEKGVEPVESESDKPTTASKELTSESTQDETSEKVQAAPGARKLASEHDIDLETIEGTGPNGAVLRADIEEHIGQTDEEAVMESAVQTTDDGRTFASPSTRRLARELGVSIDSVDGSDGSNRISESDVRAAAGQLSQSEQEPKQGSDATRESQQDIRDTEIFGVTITEERDLTKLRQTIAERMTRSARQAPHVTNKREVSVKRALEAADDLATELDAPINFTDILIAAVNRALEVHPEFNAWFEGDRLRLVAERNVAIAVDTDAGLVTPVIRETDIRTLDDIANERRRLTDAVLAGNYSMEDIQGGTFTITNLGMFGVDSFDPIINPPQVGILGVGRIRDDDKRSCVLSLSFDHRAVDGADAARFLETLVEGLESPALLVTHRTVGMHDDSDPSHIQSTDTGHGDSTRIVGAEIARELEERAQEVAVTHGWLVPKYKVQIGGDVPTVIVDAPSGASDTVMKRLTYAACRESKYAHIIKGFSDPNIII